MRADVARADRHAAVRAAAQGWWRAGAIDEATLRAIAAAYPDDRARLGLGLRILAGLAAFVGGCAMAALAVSLFSPFSRGGAVTPIALGLAVVFAAATEIQIGRLRRAQAGAEYATAMLAAICAALACFSLFASGSFEPDAFAIAVVCALAAWRWGYALFSAVAALFILFSISHADVGRTVWVAAGVVASPLAFRMARSPRWTPAHRRCAIGAGLVLLAGAYIAVNLYSLDHRWIEGLELRDRSAAGVWARRAAIAGTILMPAMVFYLGVRFRDRALLIAGALFTAASLITLRRYHPVGPWWLALVLAGAACLAIAVALRRWLEAGPGRERWGITADPLFEDRRIARTAQAVATLVAMSPGPRVASTGGFEGGGGRSGGGGATGKA